MAKVLLVDTNFSSVPIYRELVSLGYDVHVVGKNSSDCLAKISPHYWQLDYADVSKLAALIDQQSYAYLIPGCTDRSYWSCVAAGSGRFPGLDDPDACAAIFNKRAFRQHATQLGLPIPERLHADRLPTRWPVIIKPVDAFSGKGITVLHEADPQAFHDAISRARAASFSGECIVEAYVEGQLHSHSAFIRGGKVLIDFLVREDSTVNPFVVDTSRVVDLPAHILDRLRYCAERMATGLALADGLLHTQFICGAAGIRLIETTRRCPGDLYSQLVELTTGYPYARSYILPFLGKSLQAGHGQLFRDPIMRHTVTLKTAQSFAYLRFKSALHLERWTPLSLTGDQLSPSPQGRIGVLFCRGADVQDLDRIYEAALHRDLYEVHA